MSRLEDDNFNDNRKFVMSAMTDATTELQNALSQLRKQLVCMESIEQIKNPEVVDCTAALTIAALDSMDKYLIWHKALVILVSGLGHDLFSNHDI